MLTGQSKSHIERPKEDWQIRKRMFDPFNDSNRCLLVVSQLFQN